MHWKRKAKEEGRRCWKGGERKGEGKWERVKQRKGPEGKWKRDGKKNVVRGDGGGGQKSGYAPEEDSDPGTRI